LRAAELEGVVAPGIDLAFGPDPPAEGNGHVLEVDAGRIEDVVAALEEGHRLALVAGHVAVAMMADRLGLAGDLLLPVGDAADVVDVRMGQHDLADRAGRELLDQLLLLEGLGRVVAEVDHDRALARVDEEDRALPFDLEDRGRDGH
jgi:hypothetical protein